MLAYALAIAVGFSGLVLFSTAFFMSDIHRKDDFFWSAISLFYAIVLWFCATSLTGGVLLGQAAAVALLVSFSWQTLKLRKAIAYPEKAAELNNFSVLETLNGLLSRGKVKPQPVATSNTTPPKLTDKEISIPETATRKTPDILGKAEEADKATTTKTAKKIQTEATEARFLGKLFGGKKQQSPPSSPAVAQADTSSIANTKLNDILDDAVVLETSKPLSAPKKQTTDNSNSAQDTITDEESAIATETEASSTPLEIVEAEDKTVASVSLNPDEIVAEKMVTEVENTVVETETTDDTIIEEISVTDTVTATPYEDTEESVVEAVVIETSEPVTVESGSSEEAINAVETDTSETSESNTNSDVNQFLDELNDHGDKPADS